MAAKAKSTGNRYPQNVAAILSGSTDPERTRRRLGLMLPKLEAAGVPIPEAATQWLDDHPAPIGVVIEAPSEELEAD